MPPGLLLRSAMRATLLQHQPARLLRTSASLKMAGYGHDDHHHHHHEDLEPPKKKTKDGALIVNNTAFSLEWVLDSPPPLHCFIEPPIIVEWPEGEDVSGGH